MQSFKHTFVGSVTRLDTNNDSEVSLGRLTFDQATAAKAETHETAPAAPLHAAKLQEDVVPQATRRIPSNATRPSRSLASIFAHKLGVGRTKKKELPTTDNFPLTPESLPSSPKTPHSANIKSPHTPKSAAGSPLLAARLNSNGSVRQSGSVFSFNVSGSSIDRASAGAQHSSSSPEECARNRRESNPASFNRVDSVAAVVENNKPMSTTKPQRLDHLLPGANNPGTPGTLRTFAHGSPLLPCSGARGHSSIRAPITQCQQRRILLQKPPDSRFGVDLCRINGAVYVLNVHEKDANVDASSEEGGQKYLPGFRAGMSRFDEVVQLHDEDISQFTLEEVYRALHQEAKIALTVRDRPSVRTYQFYSDLEIDQLVSCLWDDNGHIRVDEEKIPDDAAWRICKDDIIAEVNGQLVLGMKQPEVAAVLRYALYKSAESTVEVATVMPAELAQAFLASYQMTSSVYGDNSWTDRDHLRKSLRHSLRRGSTSAFNPRASLRDSFRRRRPSANGGSALAGGGGRLGGDATASTPALGECGTNSIPDGSSLSSSELPNGLSTPRLRSNSVCLAALMSPAALRNTGQVTPSPLSLNAPGASQRRRSMYVPRTNRFAGRALE